MKQLFLIMNVEDWNDFISTENVFGSVTDIVETVLTQVDSRIADIHMEGIVFPLVVDFACGLIHECLEVKTTFYIEFLSKKS